MPRVDLAFCSVSLWYCENNFLTNEGRILFRIRALELSRGCFRRCWQGVFAWLKRAGLCFNSSVHLPTRWENHKAIFWSTAGWWLCDHAASETCCVSFMLRESSVYTPIPLSTAEVLQTQTRSLVELLLHSTKYTGNSIDSFYMEASDWWRYFFKLKLRNSSWRSHAGEAVPLPALAQLDPSPHTPRGVMVSETSCGCNLFSNAPWGYRGQRHRKKYWVIGTLTVLLWI